MQPLLLRKVTLTLSRFATGMILWFSATPALCDESVTTAPIVAPVIVERVVGEGPTRVNHLPALPADSDLKNGMTRTRARNLSTKVVDGKYITVLTGEPKIDHSSPFNGTFTISANTIHIYMPSDVFATRAAPLHNLDATGSCIFNAGPLRITSRQIVMRTDPDAGQSTLEFSGDVSFATNGVAATADSVSLTRNVSDWILSGVLAAPKSDE